MLLSLWLLDCLIVMRDYYFHKLTISMNQWTHSFQAPLLPELKLLLAVHPVTTITVGLVLWLPAAAEGYSVPGFIHAAICRFNGDTASNPKVVFTIFLSVVNQYNRWFKLFFKGFACLFVPQDQSSWQADNAPLWRFVGLLSLLIFVWDSLFHQTAGRNENDHRARGHRWVLDQDLQTFPLFPGKAFCWLFRYRQNQSYGGSHHRRACFWMSYSGIRYKHPVEVIPLYQLILWWGQHLRW